jgi:hypothetical protein
MNKTATKKRTSLHESTASTTLQVDREAGVISGVKCLGRVSRNNREYTDSALADAARLYEGNRVNLNHQYKGERPISDGFGVIKSTRVESDGVYADLHYIKSHPLAEAIAERAERFPNTFGLSHDASGSVTRKGGKDLVEGLDTVNSIDIVSVPATNKGLFESERPIMQLKESLAALTDNAKAQRLIKLFEDDSMAAMAEMPMPEMSDEAGPDDQVKAALKAMIIAVVDDESLDDAGKLKKIKQILGVQADLLAKAEAATTETDTSADAPMAESFNALKDQVEKIARRDAIRESLESFGVSRADLTSKQRELIDAAPSAEAAVKLIEGFEPRPAKGSKPAVRSIRESEETNAEEAQKRAEAARRGMYTFMRS